MERFDRYENINEIAPGISAHFIDFLARWMDDNYLAVEPWPDQISENLRSSADTKLSAQMRFERLMTSVKAQEKVLRAKEWFLHLSKNDKSALDRFQDNFKFIAVIGVPRTGGSYLTAEIYRSLGYDPTKVPSVIAHDGHPEARPALFQSETNDWIELITSVSEYLTMVEIFFLKTSSDGPQIVPKKLLKAVYAGGFFRNLLGPEAEFIITVRHPIDCCVSTYDKSGGIPENSKIMVRSTIEKWIKRDILFYGIEEKSFSDMEYFSAYIKYWELYYINLAVCGLLSKRNYRVSVFSDLEDVASDFHRRFGSGKYVNRLVVSEPRHLRHREWNERALEAIARVSSVWRLFGMEFPERRLLDNE